MRRRETRGGSQTSARKVSQVKPGGRNFRHFDDCFVFSLVEVIDESFDEQLMLISERLSYRVKLCSWVSRQWQRASAASDDVALRRKVENNNTVSLVLSSAIKSKNRSNGLQ
jgi:hypothetical protein